MSTFKQLGHDSCDLYTAWLCLLPSGTLNVKNLVSKEPFLTEVPKVVVSQWITVTLSKARFRVAHSTKELITENGEEEIRKIRLEKTINIKTWAAVDQSPNVTDYAIHNFMHFLPTLEATWITILSRRFASLRGIFPIINFDQWFFI